ATPASITCLQYSEFRGTDQRLPLTERPRQLQTYQVVDAVVPRPELAVLDVAHEPLGEERIAVREAPGYVDSAPEPLLLRAREAVDRAADDGPLDVEADHQIRRHTGRDPPEVVAAVGPDEVGDDMTPGPVAARELIV